ncbi:MAG: PAS domain-containing protein [Pseudomonadota bacterium]
MKWAEIAYLDLAVSDYVRDHIVQGDAVAIVERATLVVRWTNGVAAQWLGLPTIGAVEDDGKLLVEGPGARQLASALARPLTEKRVATARTNGHIPALTQMHIYPFGFAGQTRDDLAAIAFTPTDQQPNENKLSAALVGLNQDDASAAILDARGDVLEATSNFHADALVDAERLELCQTCAEETDRMVKRILANANGQFAVGVGRLSDAPLQFLLLLMPSVSTSSSISATTPIRPEDASVYLEDTVIIEENSIETVAEPPETPDVDIPDMTEEDRIWSPANLSNSPIRFVWKTDRDGVFVDMSSEFASAVGPRAADVVGKPFLQVAEILSLDPDGEIEKALQQEQTWSGKTVLWPIDQTEFRVPVDLAALPYYDRERVFEGYRGFGIARMADLVVDDSFQSSSDDTVWEDDDTTAPTLQTLDTENAAMEATGVTGDPATDAPVEDDPLQGEPPALHSATITPMRRENDGFISDEKDGEETGETTPDLVITPLSTEETDAFERIRAELAPLSHGVAENEDSADNGSTGQVVDNAPYGLGPEALDTLPLALMIARDEDVLYLNRAFSELTGFGSVDKLNNQGMSALFGGPASLPSNQPEAGNDNGITLVDRHGDTIAARSHLQRVPWMGRNALMFAFEPAPSGSATADTDHVDGLAAKDGDAPLAERANEPLEAENAELRAILDTATDGVITIDEQGDIRSMNAAATALFGYETDVLIGQSFTILFAHESQKEVLNYVHSMVTNGVANVLNEGREVTGQEVKGGEIKLFMTLGKLGASQGLCAVLRDITAWKRNEKALEEARHEAESASEMKSAFLAKVSHEIRTPLNAIIGFSEIMSEERFGPIGNEKYKDYLDDIKKSGRYVVDLVNDLLDISKIESGNEELQFESVSLNETVSEVIDMLRPQANRNRIIVRVALDFDLPPIVADQRAAKQITINLLSNAIRFTPEGGQVVVSTRYLTDGSVTLRFRDTGIGMTREELEGALRPFKQVGADDELRAAGTGLGLPLTRALVEANRAEFEISSKPGEGTDVEIIFPAPRVLSQ